MGEILVICLVVSIPSLTTFSNHIRRHQVRTRRFAGVPPIFSLHDKLDIRIYGLRERITLSEYLVIIGYCHFDLIGYLVFGKIMNKLNILFMPCKKWLTTEAGIIRFLLGYSQGNLIVSLTGINLKENAPVKLALALSCGWRSAFTPPRPWALWLDLSNSSRNDTLSING